MNESKPKRRRFQFTLGTLFLVITAFGLVLGYQLNWIRERHEFLKLPKVSQVNRPGGTPAPVYLRVFGETGVSIVVIDGDSDREIAQRLFPEAEIVTGDHNGAAPVPPPPPPRFPG